MKRLKNIFIVIIIIMSCTNQIIPQLNHERENQINNLRAFAKLYGYVRFFHPSDEAASLDWDKFAIYGAEKVKNAKSDLELKETLKELFLPIAPTVQIYTADEKPKDISEFFPKDTAGLKVIAWQHLGVGLNSKSVLYYSIRTNKNYSIQVLNIPATQNFGHFSQTMDAISLRGKKIKLTANVKADITGNENHGHLWLRVDRENNQRGFFNNMNDKPITLNEWKEYEINGAVAKDASKIFFGGFLKGQGKVWFDNFRLYYLNNDSSWVQVKVFNPGFEETNKDMLAISWDYDVPGFHFWVDDNEKKEGRNSLLVERTMSELKHVSKLFEKYPNIGEIINKEFSPGMFYKIPLALYEKNNIAGETNYKIYLDSLLAKLNVLKLSNFNGDSENVRLGNVVNAWNVFQHFYPYFDVVKVDWDNVLTETLTDALQDKTSDQFYNTLRKMVAKLQDGHGVVNCQPKQRIGDLSIKVEWIENQLVVVASENPLFKKGDIIEKVDSVNSNELLLNEEKYVSGSPQLKKHRALNEICDGPLNSTVEVLIIRDGKELNISSIRKTKTSNLFFSRITEFDFPSFKRIEDGIYYINLVSVTKKQFSDSLEVLSKAKGIIFDERVGKLNEMNKDMFYPLEIIPNLIDSTVHSAWMNIPQTIYPDRQKVTYNEGRWTITPKAPRIKAKIVFINIPSVVSYGESYMGIFENYKLAEFVGEPTAGTNGNVNFIDLPGGFNIMWTGMKVIKQDGSQHHLIGIQPTYPVQKTIKAVKEGRDEYLEKAIEVLKSK